MWASVSALLSLAMAGLASILGPVTYGAVTWITGGNHRLAILATGVFFVVAIAFLAAVDERRGHAAAYPPTEP